MATTIPFFLSFHKVLVAGGVDTLTYAPDRNQTLHINKLIYTSTGIWGIYQIRNSNGRIYGNLSQATTLRSEFLQKGASPNIGIPEFPYEFVVIGADAISFDIIDLSGAGNTVDVGLFGSLELGA